MTLVDVCYPSETLEKIMWLILCLCWLRWRLRNRNHSAKGWACAQDGSCQWSAWPRIWFWFVHVIFQVILAPCPWYELPDIGPAMADGITSAVFLPPSCCTGCLVLPELPGHRGTPTRLPDAWPAPELGRRCRGRHCLARCCLPVSFFWVMPQPTPIPLHRCLRAVLSFQLWQSTMQMLCKTASVTQ